MYLKYIPCFLLALLMIIPLPVKAQTNYTHWNYLQNPPSTVNQWHVTPTGSSTNNGLTKETAWDLPTALKGGPTNTQIKPGDIVWLHQGVYQGRFTSTLKGTDQQPIYVVAAWGDRVTLDGYKPGVNFNNADILRTNSTYTIYWGFEITSSDPDRWVDNTGSSPSELDRGNAITTLGGWNSVGDKFINLIVHDGGGGYGNWTPALNTEIYGNIIYNNGWKAPDRGHGHGIYAQNLDGTKKIHHNMVFNQFSYNLHVYTEGGSVQGFDVQENIFLNNNNIIGGYKSPDRITYSNNFVFGLQQLATNGRGINGLVQGNYFFGTVDVGVWSYWENFDFLDNTIMPTGTFKFARFTTNLQNHDINRNKYRKPDGSAILSGLTIPQLQSQYSLETQGIYETDRQQTWILPNKYQPGRAHLIINNPNLNPTVTIDISELGYATNDTITIRNALNYYADTQQVEYQDSPIDIDMVNRTVATRVHDPQLWQSDIENYIYQSCLIQTGGDEAQMPNCLSQNQTVKQSLINSINVSNPYPKYGFFVIETTPNPQTIIGDINQDQTLNILDIISLIPHIFSQAYSSIYDINQDSQLNLLDVFAHLNVIIPN